MRRLSKKSVVKNTSGSGFLGFDFLLSLLTCVLPLALIFSYHPVINLGVGEAMNFELSVPLIWLVVFDIVGVVAMVAERKVKIVMRWWKWLMFPAFVTLSLVWSANVVRGVLTCGVMWLVVIAVMIMAVFRGMWISEEFRKRFLKWFLGAAMVACVWCVVQCILDLVGASREYSLMCLGCTSRTFGFPHPNGFAIEPQFMGNLLIAPALAAAWLYLKKQGSKKSELEPSRGRVFYNRSGGLTRKLQFPRSSVTVVKNTSGSGFLGSDFLLPCFFIIVATLFLVFSRGAIYAFIVGMMFMSGWVVMREKKRVGVAMKRLAVVWGVVVGAFLFTLNLQGIMTQVGPTNDTYADGVAKVLNQLSLRIIDIRAKGETGKVESASGAETSLNETETDKTVGGDAVVVEKPVENLEENREEVEDKKAVFDGYVEESTEVRKMMTRNALKVWSGDVRTMMLGVGIGGAGQAMYEAGLIDTPKEIVQNEYASVLLEMGIVGAALVVVLIIMIIIVIVKSKSNASGMVLALMVAYGVSLIFFAGFANALQIYLLPMLIFCATIRVS